MSEPAGCVISTPHHWDNKVYPTCPWILWIALRSSSRTLLSFLYNTLSSPLPLLLSFRYYTLPFSCLNFGHVQMTWPIISNNCIIFQCHCSIFHLINILHVNGWNTLFLILWSNGFQYRCLFNLSLLWLLVHNFLQNSVIPLMEHPCTLHCLDLVRVLLLWADTITKDTLISTTFNWGWVKGSEIQSIIKVGARQHLGRHGAGVAESSTFASEGC